MIRSFYRSLLLLLLLAIDFALADYGDYVDSTFDCPARTTCPRVCVANVGDCPTTCADNEKLCLDGTCVDQTKVCLAEATTCPHRCAPVACPKTIDLLTTCQIKFAAWYENATLCGKLEVDQIPLKTFTEAPFVFCYCWMACIICLIVVWGFFNQFVFPVRGSTRVLDCRDTIRDDFGGELVETKLSNHNSFPSLKMNVSRKLSDDTNNGHTCTEDSSEDDNIPSPDESGIEANSAVLWTQTGYRGAFAPYIIYLLVMLSLFGIHVLLGVLTTLYYVQQGAVSILPKCFQSDVQSLQAFEIAWAIGVVFSLVLQWPQSIESLFLRRSLLSRATWVAVFVPFEAESKQNQAMPSSLSLRRIQKLISSSFNLFTRFMGLVFCDFKQSQIPGTTSFVQVEFEDDGTRFFYFRYSRFTFDNDLGKFVQTNWNVGSTLGDYLAASNGLSNKDIAERRGLVGSNTLRLKKPNFFRSVVEEFGKPFYTYQYFIIWSWFPFWYFLMALVYAVVVLAGGLAIAVLRYRQDSTLAKLSGTNGEVTVLRDNNFLSIPEIELVPGDVVVVKPGIACCDMVLVRSVGILMDESALTGESTPMLKTGVDPADTMVTYNRVLHKKHTISAGTIVLETNDANDLAVVSRTGSFTVKGDLLKGILSNERFQFKFDIEVKLVILILCIEAVVGFSIVLCFLEQAPAFGFFYGMYVVATCLPPLLPTIFTVSVGVSDQRLAKKRIAVANSAGILVAGKVTRVFFDKTGTLTKQGLDFVSARSTWGFSDEVTSSLSNELSVGMATCHNLSITNNGILVGKSVDLIMFASSGAKIERVDGSVVHVQDSSGQAWLVVKHFEFDHQLALQSVIVADSCGRLVAFVKGGGENIKRCCRTESVPSDFDEEAKKSAKCGLYQIAMAMKELGTATDLTNISRGDIEQDLTFIGVINFKNVLRSETPNVIQQLKDGDCQVAVITGDHVLTGICIARESGIIESTREVLTCSNVDSSGTAIWTDENDCQVPLPSIERLKAKFDLAITGKAWSELTQWQPRKAERLAPYVRVFGRCTPNDKVSVVSTFVKQGCITLMCGDGGNDCGALKTAHVGIALSDAEASLVSPFTSLDKCITSVPEVLKEGRCALASSLASYKFMIMYGQLETIIQIVNAYFKISFGKWNWAFMDGFWTISLAFAIPLAMAATDLAPARPVSSLFGLQTLSSVGGVLFINVAFFAGALILLFSQDWYLCRRWNSSDVSQINEIGDNYESEVIWLVAGYQYISSAMAFNYGYEFRQGWGKNIVFLALVIAFTAIHFVAILVPSNLSCIFRVNCDNSHVGGGDPIENVYNTTVMPEAFRCKLLVYVIINTVVVQLYEYFVVNGIGTKIARSVKRRRGLPNADDLSCRSCQCKA